MKIVIIGAGSRCFGRGMIADLVACAELRGRGVEVALVDADGDALATMHRLALRMGAHAGSDLAFTATCDRREALPAADYVLTAVARRRYELWEQDYRVPRALGFDHVLGENGGPGALFHGLRSLELVIPICRDIERLCPQAFLFNFTNPEARVLHGITRLTTVRAAGMCHGVMSAEKLIYRLLGVAADEVEITSAGMNHCYCILKVVERASGRDRLPELIALAEHDQRVPPLFRKLLQIFGIFTFPSDDHVGEYFSYGSEFHGARWAYGRESRAVSAIEAPHVDALAEIAAGRRPLDAATLAESGEYPIPIIADITLGRRRRHLAVNVLNTEGWIANLPRDAVVEVPAWADGAGLHPERVGEVPETFAAAMRTQFSIHRLATEAWRTRDRRLLLQALLLDPCVGSILKAERLLDEMLTLQKDFLPDFTATRAEPMLAATAR